MGRLNDFSLFVRDQVLQYMLKTGLFGKDDSPYPLRGFLNILF